MYTFRHCDSSSCNRKAKNIDCPKLCKIHPNQIRISTRGTPKTLQCRSRLSSWPPCVGRTTAEPIPRLASGSRTISIQAQIRAITVSPEALRILDPRMIYSAPTWTLRSSDPSSTKTGRQITDPTMRRLNVVAGTGTVTPQMGRLPQCWRVQMPRRPWPLRSLPSCGISTPGEPRGWFISYFISVS